MRTLLLIVALLFNTSVLAANPEQDLVDYLQTSSLGDNNEKLQACQKDFKELRKKVYSSGFWNEIIAINKLGPTSLTNELNLNVIGDSLQVINIRKSGTEPSELYVKGKQLLIASGLQLIYETTNETFDNNNKTISIFKKKNYFVNNIEVHIDQLKSEYIHISQQLYSCFNQILKPELLEKLNAENEQKRLTLINNFYVTYPKLKEDKILEKIFRYQSDRTIYFNPYLQSQILQDYIKNYDSSTKSVITHIFNTAMKDSYVKIDGPKRESNTYFYDLKNATQSVKQDINNIIYYNYDAVNAK